MANLTGEDGTLAQVAEDGGLKELRIHDTSGQAILNSILIQLGGGGINQILVQNEFSISTRSEVDVSGVTYTVPTSKVFKLVAVLASTDNPTTSYFRLKVNNVLVTKMIIGGGATGQSSDQQTFGASGIQVATAGQIVKMTHESQAAKGSGWCGFVGYIQDA